MSEDVSKFLEEVNQLAGRSTDEARDRELEEKILQDKKDRQARRRGKQPSKPHNDASKAFLLLSPLLSQLPCQASWILSSCLATVVPHASQTLSQRRNNACLLWQPHRVWCYATWQTGLAFLVPGHRAHVSPSHC